VWVFVIDCPAASISPVDVWGGREVKDNVDTRTDAISVQAVFQVCGWGGMCVCVRERERVLVYVLECVGT